MQNGRVEWKIRSVQLILPTFSPSLHKIQKVVVIKNKPVLYYLGSNDDEFAPMREFV